MMRINIENAIRHMDVDKEGRFALDELIKHMKQFRDRALDGDPTVLAEFFNLYRFSDNQTGLDDMDFPEPDRFVARFADVLKELETVRERRAEALQIAEERRDEIQKLMKRVDTTQYWLDRFMGEAGGVAVETMTLKKQLKEVVENQTGDELVESIRFLLDMDPKGEEWLPEPAPPGSLSRGGPPSIDEIVISKLCTGCDGAQIRRQQEYMKEIEKCPACVHEHCSGAEAPFPHVCGQDANSSSQEDDD